MLTILTTTNTKETIETTIQSIERLNELVDVVTDENQLPKANKILVVSEKLGDHNSDLIFIDFVLIFI